MLTRPVIALIACACLVPVAGAAPVRVVSPSYGTALFAFYGGAYLDSIIEIEAALQRQRLGDNREPARLLLGGLLLAYGVEDRARTLFDEMLDAGAAPDVRDQVWLSLGRFAQRNGDFEQARHDLARVSSSDPVRLQEARLRLGLVALRQSEPQSAVQILESADSPDTPLRAYVRFNRAVALSASGDRDAALALLEQLGQVSVDDVGLSATDPATRASVQAISDRARLLAAYQLLDLDRAEQASQVFERISLDGLASEQALLGAGWAAVARGDYLGALGSWQALRVRSGFRTASLEAAVAIGHAKSRLGAGAEAERDYQAAIETLQTQRRRIAQMRQRLESGRLSETLAAVPLTDGFGDLGAALAALRAWENSDLLEDALVSNEFGRALTEYLEFRRLLENSLRKQDELAVYRTMLDTRGLRYEQVLPRIRARLQRNDRAPLRARREALAGRLPPSAPDRGARLVDVDADGWSLADARELGSRADLAGFAQRLQAVPESPRRDALLIKVRRLRALLDWQVSSAYPARLWGARKALRAVDAQLEQLDQHWLTLARADSIAADRLAALEARLQAQAARLGRLLPRIVDARDTMLAEMREVLSVALADAELDASQYLRQARYGLAELYDRSVARRSARP